MEKGPTILISEPQNNLLLKEKELEALDILNNISENYEIECSPSKNCSLGPWLSARQSLNHIYNKKVASPMQIKKPVCKPNRFLSVIVPIKNTQKEHCFSSKTPISFSNNYSNTIVATKAMNLPKPNNTVELIEKPLSSTNQYYKQNYPISFPKSLNSSHYNLPKPVNNRNQPLGNYKFKITLASLSLNQTHTNYQQINNSYLHSKNQEMDGTPIVYLPKNVILKGNQCKYIFKQTENMASKENNPPNIEMRTFYK